jgi:predicted aldo/keto reductase-like oxidoreductase
MNKMLQFNRRGFIRSTLLGTAGAIAGASALANTGKKAGDTAIIRRQLGKTDIELPIVSFGVMRADNPALVKSAFDMGFVHFDTAHGYQEGRNESMLGELFKETPRNKFVIATKVGADGINRETGDPGPATTKEGILTKFETSLARLKLKFVDILYLHGVSTRNTAMAPQILEAFEQLKKEGKIRYAGMSTHKNEPDVIQAAIDSNFYDVVLTSINFKHSLADQIKQKAELAAKKGIGIVAMKTMAGGFMDKERQKPVNCVAALKWVLQDPNIHTSIPGIISYDQMMQNFSVMENLEFTEKEKADIEEAKLISGLYCDGCSQCHEQCKKHLPVQDYMRAYMYTYGYRHYENAYSLIGEIGQSSNPCGDCDECTVDCAKGFRIAERITDVARLSEIPRDLLV